MGLDMIENYHVLK